MVNFSKSIQQNHAEFMEVVHLGTMLIPYRFHVIWMNGFQDMSISSFLQIHYLKISQSIVQGTVNWFN